ncbi:ABC transporter ATP-binding protein [Sedimentibacter sp. zth1]|uniref:ABC transporter ATP-binding protein n=1 Tax=Sedimentibacter sp. zth1 TaxID=2816908 RepID=UPI001A90E7FE|nr:ABC transporter ATP-binding protein [Sedimentibacter sp. zth1]QSX05863.1 ABC transporter ATP-binding protein [Sedimentibacter sp. zth1]
MEDLLQINNMTIEAKEKHENITIVDDISLKLKYGQTLGIVGESGCGKSITALSILGLLRNKLSITKGEIIFENANLATMNKEKLRDICGNEIGMIFQEPMTALNPLFTIGRQIIEPLRIHLKLSKKEARKRSIELLNTVGINNPEGVLKCYPFQFSGGMRQRVMIAIAISCTPKLLIADEPTTALDVTIQAQILQILKKLIKDRGMSLLLISHDLGVISKLSEQIIVMYSGEIVENDTVDNIINNPLHPYTQKLLSAATELSSDCEYLSVVNGSVPRPEEKIVGCKFSARCEYCKDICLKQRPPLTKKSTSNGLIKCWKYDSKYSLTEEN